jgi:acyl-CoA synthetase (AMP-forming)/AMP-acid ligase II
MLGNYLQRRAATDPDAPAILARRRTPLSYAGLFEQVARTLDALNRAGYGRGDRIGLALPPGPETAVAVLAGMTACIVVPLNPASSAVELRALLPRSRVDALITMRDFPGNVARTAAELGIPLIDLVPAVQEAAGRFHLFVEPRGRRAQTGFSKDDELAVVFLSSGTTALPKLIPLTQADICAHGQRAMRYLGLISSDRCLDLLPPFHHCAVSVSVLSTIFAGASGVYPSAMGARRFLNWAQEFQPTWCAAPPPFFPSLLAELESEARDVTNLGIHTLVACGAHHDEGVAAILERTFRANFRNCYGATECGGISVNPVAPGINKRGSVGLSVGLQIRIVDETGESLPIGRLGEIVVCGPGVFRGYEADPHDNANTFFGEWYRTGDLGYFDGDGYLFLAGRAQEIINRGGEKIAPAEIEEVLRSHPDVEDAVAFAVPHPVLGEDVVAAVVLKPSAEGTDPIHRFAAERLSSFKLPQRLLVVPEIPKGPSGKVPRRRLASLVAAELARGSARTNPRVRS